jgi:hypothetical protein
MKSTLPVFYTWNNKAWMIELLFTIWVTILSPLLRPMAQKKKNPFFITAHCQCTWLPKNSDEDVKMGLMFPWLLTQNPFGSPWIKE